MARPCGNVIEEPDMSNDEKIRAKAHEIWLAEGKPEGKEKAHWNMAKVAIEGKGKNAPAAKKTAAPKAAAKPKAAPKAKAAPKK
jgi:hypothetical protein